MHVKSSMQRCCKYQKCWSEVRSHNVRRALVFSFFLVALCHVFGKRQLIRVCFEILFIKASDTCCRCAGWQIHRRFSLNSMLELPPHARANWVLGTK